MSDIVNKYNSIRPYLQEGDVILFHGKSIVSRLIQWFDNAHWNHVGVIIECNGALGICDANGNGVQWDRLSWRISKYSEKGDFIIMRSLNNSSDIKQQLRILLAKSDKKWIKYDFINGVKEMFNRKFGFKLKIKLTDDKAICSTSDAGYVIGLDMMLDDFKNKTIQFPQDYMRFFNPTKTMIFGYLNPIEKK